MKKIIFGGLFFALIGQNLYAKDVCYEYDPSAFRLEARVMDDTNAPNYLKTKTFKIDRVVLCLHNLESYETSNDFKNIPITVYVYKNSHRYKQTCHDCMSEIDKKEKKNVIKCWIDVCDSGLVNIIDSNKMKLDWGTINILPTTLEGNSPMEKYSFVDLELLQTNKKYLSPIATVDKDKIDPPKIDKEQKGFFVCYDYKENNKYKGCYFSHTSCLERFGQYPTEKEAKKALIRCKNSKPNPDYIDNPKGLYVCYDRVDDTGTYKGCFRATKSCKRLHKKHFGHYPNRQKSYEALLRCVNSIPFS